MSPMFLLVTIAVPTAILLAGGRLAAGSRVSLVLTSLTTLMITAAVLTWLLPDPSNISAALLFYFVLMPCTGAPIAAVVATRLVRTRGRLLSALTLAFLGWIAGIVALMVATRITGWARWPYYFWDYALSLAPPAIYSACGAVVAAGVRDRD